VDNGTLGLRSRRPPLTPAGRDAPALRTPGARGRDIATLAEKSGRLVTPPRRLLSTHASAAR